MSTSPPAIALAAFLFLCCLAARCFGDGARPNFVLILTDDHGYGDVSAYGASDVRTPNIDGLASEGMLFTAMRANATVCSPSRAALLTGRHADRVGVPGVIRTDPQDSWGYFDPKVPTLADELRKAGYVTAIVGKWHLGLESPNTPNERGFDHFHGFLGDMMDSYTTHRRHGKRQNFDLFPTFLELAGANPSPDLDAVSLVPLLRGNPIAKPRDLYFVRREGGAAFGGKSYEAIIRGDWKLMQNDPFRPMELYNLRDDPGEKTNLIGSDPPILNNLRATLRRHIQRGGATPWQKPQP